MRKGEPMDRRAFLRAAAVAPVAALAPGLAPEAAPSGRPAAWPVLLLHRSGTGEHLARVIDAATGEDVSGQFPVRNAPRLFASYLTGRPKAMTLFRLNAAGRPFLSGYTLATRRAYVQVVGLVEA